MRITLPKSRKTTVWHKWFAWRPIVIRGGELVWLEHVMRREVHGYAASHWEYKECFV